MTILGIDPGTARVGWAVIKEKGGNITVVDYGCIITNKDQNPAKRLKDVYASITLLLTQHSPDSMAVEELFFSTNTKTAISVGQARGVIILAAAQKQIQVVSYSEN